MIVSQMINSQEIILSQFKDDGSLRKGLIQSEHFISVNDPQGRAPQGFRLNYNGDVEFNNGVFRGELQARYIRATGSVSSGIQYILRTNNTLSIIDSYESWIAATFEAVAKEIRTLAKGSCTIRLRFPTIASPSMGNRNVGSYKIVVNDTIIRNWTSYTTNIDIDISNVSLPNEINTVKLYGEPSPAGNLTSFGFYNSIFELRCAQDPGFLGMLG